MAKKVSEWLAEIDSHAIYDSAAMKDEFRKETGQTCDWPEFTEAETRKAMQARGLGGTIKKNDGKALCYGYTTAIALASQMVPGFHSSKLGRGSAFYQALEALQAAGL